MGEELYEILTPFLFIVHFSALAAGDIVDLPQHPATHRVVVCRVPTATAVNLLRAILLQFVQFYALRIAIVTEVVWVLLVVTEFPETEIVFPQFLQHFLLGILSPVTALVAPDCNRLPLTLIPLLEARAIRDPNLQPRVGLGI